MQEEIELKFPINTSIEDIEQKIKELTDKGYVIIGFGTEYATQETVYQFKYYKKGKG